MPHTLIFEETSRGVYAAWRLFLRDSRAARLFENSYAGAVRSYWAAMVILPVYVTIVIMEYITPAEGYANFGKLASTAGLLSATISEIVIYTLCWFVAWPLVVDRVAPFLKCDENFFRYVSAYNWMHVIYAAFGLLYWTLVMSGLVHPGNSFAVALSMVMVLWVYHWFLLRHALELNGGMAAMLVALEFVMVIMLKDIILTTAL